MNFSWGTLNKVNESIQETSFALSCVRSAAWVLWWVQSPDDENPKPRRCWLFYNPENHLSFCYHQQTNKQINRWMQTQYQDLQSAPPPCGSAVSWGLRCGRWRRSPCLQKWRWRPLCWAQKLPERHCGSWWPVMETGGWAELEVEDGRKKKLNTIPHCC